MKIKSVVMFEWEIPRLPKDGRLEDAMETVRQAIKDKILDDGNAYYQNDEGASMIAVDIKEFGI